MNDDLFKKEQQKKYQKNYYLANKQKASVYGKLYREKNKQFIKRKAHLRYLENRENSLKNSKEYYIQNKDKISFYKKKWYKDKKEKS